MITQCNPKKLLIINTDPIEHFQLPQCYIRSLPEGLQSFDARFIMSIPEVQYMEFTKSKFVRLADSALLHDLKGSRLEVLRELCKDAHPSEEFFVTIATNQWLRTAIKGDSESMDLFSLSKAKRQRHTIIHSNVLPYDPYWRRPLAIGDDSSSRVHFPCYILKDAKEEGKTIMDKVNEWRDSGNNESECDIIKHEEDGNSTQQRPSKKFWEVLDKEVATQKASRSPSESAQVSQVKWRGGKFIKKVTKLQVDFDAEVYAMEKLCHPHIVYIFGINYFDGKQGSLYMECMESDLFDAILEKNARPEGGKKGLPFSHYNSIDILLQIAKAMVHMHEKAVIHGDLKSPNILISKFEISENRCHYLAKVADFGSAKMKIIDSFKPAYGTTKYAAPEVYQFRKNQTFIIKHPEKIDIYSFGIVAFEVLTGKTMNHVYKGLTPTQVKEGIMEDTLKLPLEAECQEYKFGDKDSLISLIERCWDSNPSKRPSFPEIVKVLEKVRVQIPELASQSNDPLRQVDDHSIADDVRLQETSLRNNHDRPSPSLDQANNIVVDHEQGPNSLEMSVPSGSNGHLQSLPDQVDNTSATLHVEDPRPRRRHRRRGGILKKLLHFSCVCGGKVQD